MVKRWKKDSWKVALFGAVTGGGLVNIRGGNGKSVKFFQKWNPAHPPNIKHPKKNISFVGHLHMFGAVEGVFNRGNHLLKMGTTLDGRQETEARKQHAEELSQSLLQVVVAIITTTLFVVFPDVLWKGWLLDECECLTVS